MTAREFLTNITLILALMGLAALLEIVVPMFAAGASRQLRRRANLGLTALTFVSSWLLASIAAAAALVLRPSGLMTQLGWPAWIDIVAGIVILDFRPATFRTGRCTCGRPCGGFIGFITATRSSM